MRVLLIVAFLGGLVTGCGPSEEPTDESRPSVKLALNWFPEAQHGGYYAAHVHGFFADNGIRVDIQSGGPDAPVVQRVATGQVEFGLTNADGVINARAAGAPIVAVFAPYQINPRCLVVHESSGITSIDEIANVTLALSQRPAFSHFLRKRYKFHNVRIVPYHGSVTPFLQDERFAMQGYVFSEPVVARSLGASPRALMVADTGFNPYASALIVTEQTLRDRPDLVRAVVDASRRGWQTYLETPEQTNQHIRSVNTEMDLEILAAGAQLSRDLVLDEVAVEHGIGHMSAERWQQLLAQMIEAEVVEPGRVSASDCYTMEFSPAGSPDPRP